MTVLLCGSSQTHLGTEMPSGGGHIINAIELLKATSVVSLISLADMTFQAQVVRSQTGNTFLPFVTILILYFAMSSVISYAVRAYERRVTRGLDGVR